MANMYVNPEQPGEDLPLSPNTNEPPAQVPPVPPADPDQTLYRGDTWIAEPETGNPDASIPVEFANEPAPDAAGGPTELFPGPETPAAGQPQEPPSQAQAPLPPTQPGFNPPPPPPPYQPAPPQPLSPQDERTWAMVSHLSVLVNVFTGFLGTVAALVIYLAFKDRSRYVAFHALQAFVFQLVVFIGSIAAIIVIWLLTTLLIPVLIGLLCIPFSVLLTLLLLVMPVVALVYGVIGAMQTSEGQDFRYYWLGDWVRRNMPNP